MRSVLPLGPPGGSGAARKAVSSEEAYPADPKELPECLNSWGTAGGGTFFAWAAGFGGLDIPPTATENYRTDNVYTFTVRWRHFVNRRSPREETPVTFRRLVLLAHCLLLTDGALTHCFHAREWKNIYFRFSGCTIKLDKTQEWFSKLLKSGSW